MPVIAAAAVASTVASSKRNGTGNDNNGTIHMEYRGNFFALYSKQGIFKKDLVGYVDRFDADHFKVSLTNKESRALIYCVEQGSDTDLYETTVYKHYYNKILPSMKRYAKQNNLVLKEKYILVEAYFNTKTGKATIHKYVDNDFEHGSQRYFYDIYNFCICDINDNGVLKYIYEYNKGNENRDIKTSQSKSKKHIIAVQNNIKMGYIESVSYTNNTFKLTTNIEEAKEYVSDDYIDKEIKALYNIGIAIGISFIVE